MKQIGFDKFKENIVSVFDNVLNNQEPVSVSLKENREIVILDADDYRSIMETLIRQ